MADAGSVIAYQRSHIRASHVIYCRACFEDRMRRKGRQKEEMFLFFSRWLVGLFVAPKDNYQLFDESKQN